MSEENRLSNYIPINRKLFLNHLWKEKRTYSRFEAWLDLLQSARFEDTEAKMLLGNKMVKWVRGQLPASLRFLANRWQWSTKKVSSFIEILENDEMIIKETVKETGQTIITICKYDAYNSLNEKRKHQRKQEGNSKETPRKQEGNKTNKEEESKEGKEGLGAHAPPSYTAEELNLFENLQIWLEKHAPRVNQLKDPLTIDQYLTIRKKMPKEVLSDILKQMQNRATLLKDYVSANLTIQSWYSIRQKNGESKFVAAADKDESKAKNIIYNGLN